MAKVREALFVDPMFGDPMFGDTVAASDDELVARARSGDRRAFGTLYLRHHDAAWRIALAAAGSPEDAEDAVAEGFAKVFAALPRMVDRDLSFRPYLVACVRNSALDRHRRGRKVDLRESVPDAPIPLEDPDEIVLADLERSLVGDALRTLPERWRTVLWLTEVEGMTPTEVSSVMGIKPNAVASLAYRAREGLREAYLQAHLRAEARAGCRYTVDRLGSYVRGELPERERARSQAHLDHCVVCKQRRDELADVNAGLLRSLAPVPLMLGSRTQKEWMAVAHLGRGTRRTLPPAKAAKAGAVSGSKVVRAGFAVATLALLAVASGFALRQGGDTRTQLARAPQGEQTPAEARLGVAPPTRVAVLPPTGEEPGQVSPSPAGRPPARPALRSPEQQPRSTIDPSAADETLDLPAEGAPAGSAPAPGSAPGVPPPEPERLVSTKLSVGSGPLSGVAGVGLAPGGPDADVTFGSFQLVGDSPPSKGTKAEFGGSLLEPLVPSTLAPFGLELPSPTDAMSAVLDEAVLDEAVLDEAVESQDAAVASLDDQQLGGGPSPAPGQGAAATEEISTGDSIGAPVVSDAPALAGSPANAGSPGAPGAGHEAAAVVVPGASLGQPGLT